MEQLWSRMKRDVGRIWLDGEIFSFGLAGPAHHHPTTTHHIEIQLLDERGELRLQG